MMMRIISTIILMLLLPFSQGCASVVRPENFEFPGELVTAPGQTLKYNNVNGIAIAEAGVPTVFDYTDEGMCTLTTPTSMGPVQFQPLPPGYMQPLTMDQITSWYGNVPAIAEALDLGETDLDVLNQLYFQWEADLRDEYWQCMLLFADNVIDDWDPADQEAINAVEQAMDLVIEHARQHEFISDAVAAPSLEYVTVYLTAGPEESTNVLLYPLTRLPDMGVNEPLSFEQARNLFFAIRNLLRMDPHAYIDLSTGFNAYPNP